VEFCGKLTAQLPRNLLKAGWTVQLPTEAQWEYACRAGTTGDYAGALKTMAWYFESDIIDTQPVGRKKPNAWGFYDMHGNVEEWCLDWVGGYPSGTVTDPSGPESGSYRIVRGGGFNYSEVGCGSAFRSTFSSPSSHDFNRGFRVALSSAR